MSDRPFYLRFIMNLAIILVTVAVIALLVYLWVNWPLTVIATIVVLLATFLLTKVTS
jgi:hypothetical protein